MAAVAPPRPAYRPHLPPRLLTARILSDAQLESIVYAGEAHAGHLAGAYTVDETYDLVSAAPAAAADAVRFRRDWFLGDGTGAGKGRQVAAIILDNWLKGRRRAVRFSKSDKLIEDAERDWTAVGGYRSDIVPLSRERASAGRSRKGRFRGPCHQRPELCLSAEPRRAKHRRRRPFHQQVGNNTSPAADRPARRRQRLSRDFLSHHLVRPPAQASAGSGFEVLTASTLRRRHGPHYRPSDCTIFVPSPVAVTPSSRTSLSMRRAIPLPNSRVRI